MLISIAVSKGQNQTHTFKPIPYHSRRNFRCIDISCINTSVAWGSPLSAQKNSGEKAIEANVFDGRVTGELLYDSDD